MPIVIDTSIIIAVVTAEPTRPRLIGAVEGAELIAPGCLRWEVGNAFSAMFKRRRISPDAAIAAIDAYLQIPVRLIDVALDRAVRLAARWNLYAYDAYFLECARQRRAPLLTLDRSLAATAQAADIDTVEIPR